jgi:intracellular septation protein A
VTGGAGRPRDGRNGRAELIWMCVLDVAVPLALFYGLRLAGANQWLALVVSGALPAVRFVVQFVRKRRLEVLSLFTLSVVVVGTAVAVLTTDPRMLLARESYITALIGLWMLGTLLGRRPFIFTATIRLMPESDAAQWHRDWDGSAQFRRAMRTITILWAGAFLVDAVARVVMAYTLPVDVVPVLSVVLLVVMLMLVVWLSKEYGRRQMRRAQAREEAR